MDILTGLSFAGKAISNKTLPNKKKSRPDRVKRPYPSVENTYDSKRYRKSTRDVWQCAKKKYKEVENPKESGVIPKFYNQKKYYDKIKQQEKLNGNPKVWDWSRDRDRYYFRDGNRKKGTLGEKKIEAFTSDVDSVFSDDSMSKSKASRDSIGVDHTSLMKRADNLCDNKIHEKKFKRNLVREKRNNNGDSGFLRQFDDLTFDNPTNPVSKNTVPQYMGANSYANRLEGERELALNNGFSGFERDQDMTYGMVSKENFKHNNMVPHFSSASYGSDPIKQKNLDSVKQRKLEDFTGSLNSLNYRPKTERRPLFNPTIGLTNIYGMPNMSTFMSQRYIPGRERRNEFPVQPVKVTPGLNLGYNEVSKQGYHDLYRALPKTTDQLRTANNPKISYAKPIIHGKKGDKRPVLPNVAKRRPVTFFEQDPRDFVKTTSYFKAPKIRGNWDVPIPNREQTSSAHVGPAAAENSQLRPASLLPRHKIAHKENFKHPGPMRAGSQQHGKGVAFDMKSNIPNPTLRDVHNQTNYVGPATHHQGQKTQAFDMKSNIPQPTMRDIHSKQNYIAPAGHHEGFKSQAFDMKTNIPQPTMRDIHSKRNYVNAPNPSSREKGVAFDMKTNIPQPTMRDIHSKRNYVNAPGPSSREKGVAFDRVTNIPQPTMRDIHSKQNYINPAGPTSREKGVAFDRVTNIPQPTMRDIHSKQNYVNPAGPTSREKGVAFDRVTNIPQPTMRDIHSKQNYVNGAGPTSREKGVAFDMKTNVPQPTMRDIHGKRNYVNGAGPTSREKGVAFDMKTNVPQPTMRDIHGKRNYVNAPGPSSREKGVAFDMKTNIPQPTMRDIHSKRNYVNAPGPSSREKGVAFDMKTNVPQPTMRDIHSKRNYVNAPGHSSREKGVAFDMKTNVPQPTMRDIHIKKKYLNPVGTQEHEKSYAYDYVTNVPDATMRDVHINKKYVNAPGPTERGKSYAIDYKNWTPDVTMREIHINKNYVNPTGFHEKNRNRHDANMSYVNIGKEEIAMANGRSPTTSNYEKGPVKEAINMQLSEPIQVNREKYPNMNGQNPLQCVPTMHTRMGYQLPQWSSLRFDTCIPPAVLKFNPYINNTQHKSVEY
ncbi:MAG: hypothetical protein CMF62_00150 [Magnetococcales bacterium]|nr:hypothetical protein [Magnetococcales bacterium]